MWRNKKVIATMALAAVILVGGITGAVFAQSENDDAKQPEARQELLLQRVCEIYQDNTGTAIDQESLKDALFQARKEMRTEAMTKRLNNAVTEGKITQEEADEYLEWWQSKPETPLGFGVKGQGGRLAGGDRPCIPSK